jgi:hypothetical protein
MFVLKYRGTAARDRQPENKTDNDTCSAGADKDACEKK